MKLFKFSAIYKEIKEIEKFHKKLKNKKLFFCKRKLLNKGKSFMQSHLRLTLTFLNSLKDLFLREYEKKFFNALD